MLTPLPEAGLWERLIAEGRIEPPEDPDAELPPPLDAAGGRSISDALRELREDRV